MGSAAFMQSVIDSIAHSIDIPKLSTEAAKALAPDVEYKLRELIQDAHKFARHSRRFKLTTEDVNNALRMRNAEPLYGFINKDPAKYLKAAGLSDVYCIEDPELPVEQLVDQALPRAPMEVGVMPHWLFINGVQPLTPENTPLEKPPTRRARQAAGAGAGAGANGVAAAGKGKAGAAVQGGGAGPQAGAQDDGKTVQVQLPVQHVLSLELQTYFTKAMEVIQAAVTQAKAPPQPTPHAAAPEAAAGAAPVSTTGAQQQQQQRYWGQMAAAAPVPAPAGAEAPAAAGDGVAGGAAAAAGAGAGGQADVKLEAVFGSLATDPGLHPLAPYLIKYLADEVPASLSHAPALLILLRLCGALLRNQALKLDRYVHQLLPALLTCVVAKGIGCVSASQPPAPGGPAADSWAVRQAAAQLASDVCARFGSTQPNIQPRVSKTLLQALLDPTKPLTTHYGAVVGLSALGPSAVRLLLLPQLPAYLDRLQPLLADDPTTSTATAPQAGAPAVPVSLGNSDMEIDNSTGATTGATAGGAGGEGAAGAGAVLSPQVRAARHADAVRVHGALVDAAGGALYRLMVDMAAGAVAGEDVNARSSAAALAKVADAFKPQHPTPAPTAQQDTDTHMADAAAPTDRDRSRARAVLCMCWREDVALTDVAWAAGELLGPALTARLPQARPAQACL